VKRVSFDRVADIYDETRGFPEDANEKVLDALSRDMTEGAAILDIGSGTGRFALPLSRRGFSVVGIDISDKMLGVSRSKGFNRCVRGDSSLLPFKGATFDFALATHVLHLLEDWVVTLAEVGRVVKDSLLSIVIERESGWFGEEYHELLEERGYEARKLGIGEKGLAEKMKPRSVKGAASVTHHQSADHVIDRLEGRCHSSQWEVPEELHRAVIAEMREKYSGKEIESSYDVLIYAWDLTQLDDLIAAETR
jgi:ubiquinone/menaquinone biosynthesis C-methylase UbiE